MFFSFSSFWIVSRPIFKAPPVPLDSFYPTASVRGGLYRNTRHTNRPREEPGRFG